MFGFTLEQGLEVGNGGEEALTGVRDARFGMRRRRLTEQRGVLARELPQAPGGNRIADGAEDSSGGVEEEVPEGAACGGEVLEHLLVAQLRLSGHLDKQRERVQVNKTLGTRN